MASLEVFPRNTFNQYSPRSRALKLRFLKTFEKMAASTLSLYECLLRDSRVLLS